MKLENYGKWTEVALIEDGKYNKIHLKGHILTVVFYYIVFNPIMEDYPFLKEYLRSDWSDVKDVRFITNGKETLPFKAWVLIIFPFVILVLPIVILERIEKIVQTLTRKIKSKWAKLKYQRRLINLKKG